MKSIFLILFFLLSAAYVSAQNYPIKTILKGDSVVIMTIKQSENINESLKSLKSKNEKLEKESKMWKDMFIWNKSILDEKDKKIDSLLIEINKNL
jgi:hypothetical protein